MASVTIFISLAFSVLLGRSNAADNLHILPKELADEREAYCLDGTPGAFYFTPAATEEDKNNWVLSFQGGGACTSLKACEGAAGGKRGSSKGIPASASTSGIVPPFAKNWNKVLFWYCDGLFFTGDYKGKVQNTTNGKTLYFRGWAILNAILDLLTEKYGLDKTENAFLTGCSAGGYSSYMHTDFIHNYLKKVAPGLKKYKSAPVSGLFVNASNLQGDYVFGKLMRANFELHHVTVGVNEYCLAAHEGDPAECASPEINYAYTRAPIFLANSLVDYGTLFYSYFNPAPKDAATCCRHVPTCPADIINDLNDAEDDSRKLLTTIAPKGGAPAISKPGNGAFLHNCVTHCSGITGKVKLNNMTASEVINAWYLDEMDADPKKYTHIETCKLTTTGDKICNPTCPK
eukprot:m.6562 g.6562  ORF g.6562 m.6562 type:complete len:403 (-) comp3550_c0_seq1:165-1373(-)